VGFPVREFEESQKKGAKKEGVPPGGQHLKREKALSFKKSFQKFLGKKGGKSESTRKADHLLAALR